MTSCSTLLTNNQKEVRITKHKNTHKKYTTPKHQQYNKQIHIKNLKTNTKRTINQQGIKQ
jgi:hypothetical protein